MRLTWPGPKLRIMSPNSLPGTTTVPGSSTAACSWVSMVSSRSVAPIATVPSSVASIRRPAKTGSVARFVMARAANCTASKRSSLSLSLSLPEFIIGSLLILVFFSWLGLLPPVSLVAPGTSPLSRPGVLVLPVLTLLGASLAASIRMVRAGMVEALSAEYVTMARLNGFRERMVVTRYALRNALAPTVQVLAQNIQYLVGGIVVTEYLFNYPGLGKELVDAVAIRDVREVQSVALLIAAFYLLLNIVADFLVVLSVPKLRTKR